ncbi:hypothetical protein [Corynebacterium sp. A21]|uniref:hypothetical protein n=1 Tax=Corynebacterium sp. A21 TaxID=3457318 RepID=UPI003FCF6C90
MNALGRWLQLNPAAVEQHKVSTWRLADRGDLLGYTLVVEGNAVLVGIVNAKNTGANFAPIPAEPPLWSLEQVTAWSLPEALNRIDAGEVSERDLNALYRTSGGNPKVTWTALTDTEELDPGELVAGVYVSGRSVNGTVPLDKVLTGQRKISLRPEDLYQPEQLAPHPARVDGQPELSAEERLRTLIAKWPPLK